MKFKKLTILGLSLLTISQISHASDKDGKDRFDNDKKPKILKSIGNFFSDIGDKFNKEFNEAAKPSLSKPIEYQLLLSLSFKQSDTSKREILATCLPSKEKEFKSFLPKIPDLQNDPKLNTVMDKREVKGQNVMNILVYIISR